MTYSTTFSKFISNSQKFPGSNKETKVFARVSDIILDDTHPNYNELGKLDSICSIKYRLLGATQSEKDPEQLPIAYPINTRLKEVPLIDEIVEIVNAPSKKIDDQDTSIRKEITYYSRLVNVWNSSHHNALPNELEFKEARLGDDFQELDNIASLQPYPGDIILEGRFGQSLRFSGASSPKNSITDQSNNSKPFTILRNGQKEIDSLSKLSIEDINEDDSSIYLTSDHSIELEPVSTKYDTYTQQDEPETANSFRGRQILIDSGRVFVNAKDDSILLSSNTSVGASSNSINLDGKEYIQLDANKIYIGVKASEEEQPAVLGKKHEELFLDLLKLLKGIQQTFSKMTPAPPIIASSLVAESVVLQAEIQLLETKLKSILSKKTFVE